MARAQLFGQPDFVPMLDDLSFLSGARIAMTGGRGVLGTIVANRCTAAGVDASSYEGDVVDGPAVEAWLRDAAATVVLHFAALVPVSEVERDPLRAYEVNAIGTFNLAAAMARHAPSAWLFLASSSHVYAPTPPGDRAPVREDARLDPATFYGVSKLAGERLASPVLQRFGISFCIGRIFSFGHHSQKPPYLVPSLLAKIEGTPDGGVVRVAAPDAIRDILDAETVIDVVLALMQRRQTGVVNIGAGRGLSVATVAEMLAARSGKRVRVEPEGTAQSNTLVADVARLRAILADQGGRS